MGLAVAELQSDSQVIRNMLLRFLALVIAVSVSVSTQADDSFDVPGSVSTVFAERCIDCHGADLAEGDVRLAVMAELGTDARIDLLNRVQEQLFLGRMPPEDEEQLTATERKRLADWVSQELLKYNASKLEKKLQKPEFGNYVDHVKLFSGEFKDLPGFTYDRRWLISEYIFNAKFQRMLQGNARASRKGQNVTVLGSHRFREFSLTNPFLLPDRSGVRYYADTDLTGGHLSSMLTNAQTTSEYMTDYLAKRNSKYLPAVNEIMALEDTLHATLASRRQFLKDFIAKLCDEHYGSENESLLPAFVPVTLKEVKSLEEGETYKKAPTHVALNMLESLRGDDTVYQALLKPEHESKTDEVFRQMCERIWFYFGDHERDIQGRMTILRDYMPELRENVENNRRKFKPLVYKPLAEDEMKVIETAIRKHRQPGDHYAEIIDKCMAQHARRLPSRSLAHLEETRCVLPDRPDPGRQELSGQHNRHGDSEAAVLSRVFRIPSGNHCF
jgi:hypothetical protein